MQELNELGHFKEIQSSKLNRMKTLQLTQVSGNTHSLSTQELTTPKQVNHLFSRARLSEAVAGSSPVLMTCWVAAKNDKAYQFMANHTLNS